MPRAAVAGGSAGALALGGSAAGERDLITGSLAAGLTVAGSGVAAGGGLAGDGVAAAGAAGVGAGVAAALAPSPVSTSVGRRERMSTVAS